jgi:hypothetical protein
LLPAVPSTGYLLFPVFTFHGCHWLTTSVGCDFVSDVIPADYTMTVISLIKFDNASEFLNDVEANQVMSGTGR